MIKTNKQIVLTVTLGILVSFIFTGNLLSLVIANESQRGFDNPPVAPGVAGIEISSTIENYVLRGAGYFLNGYADTLLFLNTVELAKLEGLQYDSLTKIIGDAAADMENAYTTYAALVQEAAQTPYNPDVIRQLEILDYKGFMEKNNLNPVIFKKVEGYLSKGNVRGVYYYLYTAVESILPVQYRVKAAVEAGKFPAVADLWLLGQTYSETLLFGQYVAQIFYEIK
ncbi:MAG: hypothetical protein NT166_30560 [Candidatus Aminicenantes bacterium]|nr:hypothetical protein [Candidatus Aminicenantes bacterium]